MNYIINNEKSVKYEFIDDNLYIYSPSNVKNLYLNYDISGMFANARINLDTLNAYFNTNYCLFVDSAFYNAQYSTGNVIDFKHAIDMAGTYANCFNLTGSPVCGNNVTDMQSAYDNCKNLTGSPVCGDNVTNMSYTYYNCRNLTGSPVCGNNVTTMSNTYYNCANLTGLPVCGNNVTTMSYAYSNCYNLTGSPVCGNNVNYMIEAYYYCTNLTGSPVCGDSVTDIRRAYGGCSNLTGSPVCGNSVNYMTNAYRFCSNLTGSPVCGDNVTDMHCTYYSCSNLTGSPVCGNNVTDMCNAYYGCNGLTGSPVCGNNVTSMYGTYESCTNLTGSPVCGNNVTNMAYTYYNCPNLYGDMYCYNISPGSINMYGCFSARNKQNRLNIHATIGSKFDTILYNQLDTNARLCGSSLSWTTMANGYYNSEYGIYVYNNLPYISSIKITSSPTKVSYNVGELFNNSGMTVKKVWSNGFEEPCANYNWKPVEFKRNSTTAVDIEYVSNEFGGLNLHTAQPVTVKGTSVQSYEIESGQTSYKFVKGSVPNPNQTLFDGVYESDNVGVSNSKSVVKIKFKGYKNFTVYIRSYASAYSGYTIASTLDAYTYPTGSYDTYARADTRGNQKSGTTISDYTKVEYENDGGEHFIYIVYRKDSSAASGDDKGYFLIQMEE